MVVVVVVAAAAVVGEFEGVAATVATEAESADMFGSAAASV